jgi:hypothetical protein
MGALTALLDTQAMEGRKLLARTGKEQKWAGGAGRGRHRGQGWQQLSELGHSSGCKAWDTYLAAVARAGNGIPSATADHSSLTDRNRK